MATIADLNVRLGVINDITKGLQRVERDLRRSGQRLASLGSELSVSISAPLGLIGVSAIKAAADLESLELALQSQLGSAEAARKELDLLRQSALAPGLGFEQAVRGSVTLQAVGLSAEEARKTIEQFGNGLAIAGKGASELDGVITALSQISSKGVVSAEEINQIAERLPQIRTLMQQAFGTSNTENIQALKISSEDFIRSITKELEKLPRATGGIKNSIENAGDAIKQFLGNLGQEINKTFNLAKVAEDLSKALKGAAESFAALDADTKKAIITAGAFLVALGPVIKILGVVQLTLGQGAGLLASFAGSLKTVAGAALFAANNIRLSLVIATGGLITVLAAVTAAVLYFSDSLDATKFAQEAFADASQTVTEQTAQQTAALNANFAVLLNTNSGYDQRKKAIDALQAAYPEYLKGIDLEKASNIELEAIQQKVNRAILQGVAERQKAAAVNKIYEEQAKILLRVQQLREGATPTSAETKLLSGDFFGANKIGIVDQFSESKRRAVIIQELENQIKGLADQATKSAAQFDKAFNLQGRAIDVAAEKEADLRQAYEEREEAELDAVKAGKYLKTTTEDNAKATEKAAEASKKRKQSLLDELDVLIAMNEQEQKAADAEAQLQMLRNTAALRPRIDDGEAPELQINPFRATENPFPWVADATGKFNELKLEMTGLQLVTQQLQDGAITFSEAYVKIREQVFQTGTAMEKLAFVVSDSLTTAFESGASGIKGFAAVFADTAGKLIKNLIQVGITAVVTSTLLAAGASGPIAVAIAGAAAGAAGALFNGLLKAIKVPALAKGGLAFGPTTAIVGDNPGARSNPEVIAPLDKLKSFINPQPSGGIVGEYSIRGQDLLVVLKRAEVSNQRLTGKR